MKKVIKLSESQLKDIIGKVLSEQPVSYPTSKDDPRIANGGMYMGKMGPGQFNVSSYEKPITMDSSLFENGVDKIDTESQTFLSAIRRAKSVVSLNPSVVFNVVGGASRVGAKSGYKNEDLAMRRAQNFINAAVGAGMSQRNFTMGKPVVGQSEEKNSPQARQEQFVKLYYTEKGEKITQRAAIDNTAQFKKFGMEPKKAEEKVIDSKKYYKICYWVPAESWSEVMRIINKSGGEPVKYS